MTTKNLDICNKKIRIIPNSYEKRKGPFESPFEGVNSLNSWRPQNCSQKPEKKA